MRCLIVHELTHALDDQRRPPYGAVSVCPPEELADVTNALREGHAQLVTEHVARSWGIEDAFVKFLNVVEGDVKKKLPTWVFAYVHGYDFMQAVYAARGRAGVDRVLVEFPWHAEIRNPRLWLARHPPRANEKETGK